MYYYLFLEYSKTKDEKIMIFFIKAIFFLFCTHTIVYTDDTLF